MNAKKTLKTLQMIMNDEFVQVFLNVEPLFDRRLPYEKWPVGSRVVGRAG